MTASATSSIRHPPPRRPPRVAGLLVVLLAAACTSPGDRRVALELNGSTMGTTFSVRIVAAPGAFDRRALQEAIDALLADVNSRLSTYLDDSEISRFNASRSTSWTAVSADTCRLVERALAFGRQTEGAFDITIAPLVEAWGFGPGQRIAEPLSASAVAALSEDVGYSALETDCRIPALRKRRTALAIDLSGMAKGHAVDRVARLLDERGLGDYLVEIGGEIRARGRNVDGRAWRIAIENPMATGRPPALVMELRDGALATSGDYRNYFEAGGRRYSHTIDPRSGFPVAHALTSVSVLADSAADADALATALLVLGPDAGTVFAERHSIAASFLLREGERLRRVASPAFASAAGAQDGDVNRRSPDREGSF